MPSRSLYGSEKAKTNFPAQEYLSYFAMPANPMLPAEPLANASQLVEELQQVVSCTKCLNIAMGQFQGCIKVQRRCTAFMNECLCGQLA